MDPEAKIYTWDPLVIQQYIILFIKVKTYAREKSWHSSTCLPLSRTFVNDFVAKKTPTDVLDKQEYDTLLMHSEPGKILRLQVLM